MQIAALSNWGEAQSRASAAVLARFANASLTLVGGSGEPVLGRLSDEPADVMAGDVHAQTRRRRFVCLSVDLLAAAGGDVALTQRGTVCQIGTDVLRIAKSTPNSPATGQTLLMLEKP